MAHGVLPQRQGSAAPYSTPNEAFETADGWIMVAAYNGGRWEQLCAVLGLSELIADVRFATSPQRVANRGAMRDQLAAVFKTRPSEHWLAELRAVDVLCTRVADYAELARHPQVVANAMISEMAHPVVGVVRAPGFPINSRENNALPHAAAPGVGQHSREILRAHGYATREIDEFVEAGVVRTARDHHVVEMVA